MKSPIIELRNYLGKDNFISMLRQGYEQAFNECRLSSFISHTKPRDILDMTITWDDTLEGDYYWDDLFNEIPIS